MKVYVYPADQMGCGKYRIYWPAEALQAQGYDITITPPGDDSGLGGRTADGHLISATFPEDADVIVLQRPSHLWMAEAIPFMQEAGVTVVVDMDDDLARVHPSNPAYHYVHPKWSPMINFHNVSQACRVADLVTVSTPALLSRYASHGRGALLYNCIPEAFLKIEHHDSDEVGWAGALHSHPNDPPVIGGALRQAGVDHCRIIGPAEEGLDKAFSIQCEADGLIPFEEWGEGVTRLGIGLAPLADTQFNEAKSWLKPLEYAACGVPWIGSPLPEYLRFHKLGGGLLAAKPKGWAAAIRRLRTDATYRQEQSEAGRLAAAEWTFEGQAWRWMEAWEKAYDDRH